jgi:hypothetical protein
MSGYLGFLAKPRTNPQSSLAPERVNTPSPAVLACARDPAKGARIPRDGYPLPPDLARHAPKERFAPDELRAACLAAGEGLGAEDARRARFRPAAEMVGMWRGLDLPAWVAPYALRDARLGYLKGYDRAVVSEGFSRDEAIRAARARWGGRWEQKFEAARRRRFEST